MLDDEKEKKDENKMISSCPTHGYISGAHEFCPKCDQKLIQKKKKEGLVDDENEKIELNDEERTRCEVWTRVMGYHRPVSSFNIGKKAEFEERKFFCEEKTKENEDKTKENKKKKKDE